MSRAGAGTDPRARMDGRACLEAARRLAQKDGDLRRLLETHGPPPLWARRPGFATLIQIILEQQISLASARATFRRLLAGVVPFTPARMVELGVEHVRTLGVTRQKAAYCVHLAEAIESGRMDLRSVARMDDAGVAATLMSLKGVGPWTAHIYLLMALRRPDVWPSGDIALMEAVRRVKGLRRRPTPERLARITEAWRPFRSVAARMMWQHYLAGRAKPA